MLMLLALAGAAMYIALSRGLDGSIRAALKARADELATAVAAGADLDSARPDGLQLAESDETFTQVLRADGTVLYQSTAMDVGPVLDAAERVQAAGGPLERDTGPIAGLERRVRLVARPVSGVDDTIVVAATSLEDRDDAVGLLARALLIGSPAAAALAALLGYLLAAAALSPVEGMRRDAAQISGERSGLRLTRPAADDELRRLADTLNQLLERVDSARERERGFVADASHELRTPLGILKAEIELALSRERSPAELRAALASAGEEADALADLASDLLVLARAEDGRIPLERTLVNLGNLVSEVAAAVAPGAADQDRNVDVEVAGDVIVDADAARLARAVRNLLDNALVHGVGRIAVAVRRRGDLAEIVVADDGPGMPDAFREAAFDRFSRADAARARSGSGLGLAIVRAVAEAHGGTARLGPGSEVRIEIPAGEPGLL